MMNILKFDEYISESLWKKGIERSKTGEDRLEDVKEPVLKVCDNISKIISETYKIPYSEKICVLKDTSDYKNQIMYTFDINVKDTNIWLTVDVLHRNESNEDKIASDVYDSCYSRCYVERPTPKSDIRKILTCIMKGLNKIYDFGYDY